MNILLVEDDKRVREFVVKGLKEQGWFVTAAPSAEQALNLLKDNEWDIILLDIMLPGMDGVNFTQMLRHKKNYTPVLSISALNQSEDKVRALEAGADDYLSKPFSFDELCARIKALTRRFKQNYNEEHNQIYCADLVMDTERYRVSRGNKEVSLSPKEFKLLRFLMENKNKVVTRTQILSAVWNIDYDNYTNAVDVYISYLRNKIDDQNAHKLIKTVKGRGYTISDQD